jgi:hypothetical protein
MAWMMKANPPGPEDGTYTDWRGAQNAVLRALDRIEEKYPRAGDVNNRRSSVIQRVRAEVYQARKEMPREWSLYLMDTPYVPGIWEIREVP